MAAKHSCKKLIKVIFRSGRAEKRSFFKKHTGEADMPSIRKGGVVHVK